MALIEVIVQTVRIGNDWVRLNLYMNMYSYCCVVLITAYNNSTYDLVRSFAIIDFAWSFSLWKKKKLHGARYGGYFIFAALCHLKNCLSRSINNWHLHSIDIFSLKIYRVLYIFFFQINSDSITEILSFYNILSCAQRILILNFNFFRFCFITFWSSYFFNKPFRYSLVSFLIILMYLGVFRRYQVSNDKIISTK